MKSITKVFAAFLAVFACLFISCGAKTYSAEELRQFGDELKGDWLITISENMNGDINTDSGEISVEDAAGIDDFISDLAAVQKNVEKQFVNDEFESSAKAAGGTYKVNGVNAYTYKPGVIGLNVSVEVSIAGDAWTANISYLAVKKN